VSGQQYFRNLIKSIGEWFEKPLAVPITLFVIALASYGLLINRLGYYWDDFPLTYINAIYGSEGLTRYFSTNRPVWGLLYQITFNIFNQPWQWQLNAFFWRWLSAVILWLLLQEIWRKQKHISVWISILFLVYPGFTQQHISVIYSNLLFVLDCFLLSLYFNMKAVHQSSEAKPGFKIWIWHTLALLLSLYNLLSMEYFYALELLRPLLIWSALAEKNFSRKTRLKVTILNWIPYLVLWSAVTFWRLFIFGYQTHNYQMNFFQDLQKSPFSAISALLKDIAISLWVVIIAAWGKIFQPINITEVGLRTTLVTIFIVFIIFGLIIWFLWQNRKDIHPKSGWSVILIGFIACILGGVPWWLTGLPPTLRFPSDRFTLPFILGVCMVIVGVMMILPLKSWMKVVFMGILIGFAVGTQFLVTNEFRRDWETQRRFFWQLAWRIPDLEPGTTLMANDLPVTYFSDNSLTAPLNWFWAPRNKTQEMAYLLIYPSQRLGKSLTALIPETPIFVDYLAAKFNGNTSQVVSLVYDPPACLRILDKTLDSDNRMLSMEMQAAATLSSTQWINDNGRTAVDILPKNLYNTEPTHGWCYYFELADLARQQGDWNKVASLGDIAYNLNDYPNDPSEHFPFIEGYAHIGNWVRAHELTRQAQDVTPVMSPLLCRLWHRIEISVPVGDEKISTLSSINSELGCIP
jgi:hypothetical protein